MAGGSGVPTGSASSRCRRTKLLPWVSSLFRSAHRRMLSIIPAGSSGGAISGPFAGPVGAVSPGSLHAAGPKSQFSRLPLSSSVLRRNCRLLSPAGASGAESSISVRGASAGPVSACAHARSPPRRSPPASSCGSFSATSNCPCPDGVGHSPGSGSACSSAATHDSARAYSPARRSGSPSGAASAGVASAGPSDQPPSRGPHASGSCPSCARRRSVSGSGGASGTTASVDQSSSASSQGSAGCGLCIGRASLPGRSGSWFFFFRPKPNSPPLGSGWGSGLFNTKGSCRAFSASSAMFSATRSRSCRFLASCRSQAFEGRSKYQPCGSCSPASVSSSGRPSPFSIVIRVP